MGGLATTTAGLSVVRNAFWLARGVGVVLKLTRPQEPPIFGIEWRFYDAEPAEGNAVGIAVLTKVWWRRRVEMHSLRTKERTKPKDTRRAYKATGFLRDRKLVLTWVAEDRPDTFGALVLAIDEDCRAMKGYTVLTPQNTGVTEARKIWFRK